MTQQATLQRPQTPESLDFSKAGMYWDVQLPQTPVVRALRATAPFSFSSEIPFDDTHPVNQGDYIVRIPVRANGDAFYVYEVVTAAEFAKRYTPVTRDGRAHANS